MKRGNKTKDSIILRDAKESRKSRLKTVRRKVFTSECVVLYLKNNHKSYGF